MVLLSLSHLCGWEVPSAHLRWVTKANIGAFRWPAARLASPAVPFPLQMMISGYIFWHPRFWGPSPISSGVAGRHCTLQKVCRWQHGADSGKMGDVGTGVSSWIFHQLTVGFRASIILTLIPKVYSFMRWFQDEISQYMFTYTRHISCNDY